MKDSIKELYKTAVEDTNNRNKKLIEISRKVWDVKHWTDIEKLSVEEYKRLHTNQKPVS